MRILDCSTIETTIKSLSTLLKTDQKTVNLFIESNKYRITNNAKNTYYDNLSIENVLNYFNLRENEIKEPLRQYENAQRVWKGIAFENVGFAHIGTSLKTTNISREPLSKNAPLKALYNKAVEYFLLRKTKPDVIIIYLPGLEFKGQANGLSLAYDTKIPPYLIVVSDGVDDYPWVVAHEIGHILYYTNKFNDKDDPNPYLVVNSKGEAMRDAHGNLKFDRTHNNNKNNIMYPRGSKSSIPPKVTFDQMVKVSNSYLLDKRKRLWDSK
ncbi:hypothetical protein J7E63_27900 [Bacillus sp. ISL-75]|uniref:hypothetical protein n=1 Tax=unclassified Bacillus (in: firmicutes) TaxID=185979 RepID=UPI001BE7850B|nr:MULTISPECIES: hypothetical protein [unclassified Bacillus (in: firmicutes)]MBT2730648.1 hypothetical protein [Bacillus sp. ISL-75]MBT2739960.1 hypothetical protein [Bacillus sp. ISL-77]